MGERPAKRNGMGAFIWFIIGGIVLAGAGIVVAVTPRNMGDLIFGIVLAVLGGLIAFGSLLARAFVRGYSGDTNSR